MTASTETFKSSLQRLIANFESDKLHYLSKDYLEAQARNDFITPFFEALGWDMANRTGLPHDAREVVVERGESDTPGRPDYSFRVAGQTNFFAEAKAPSEPLNVAKHIVQAKGYAWNTRQVFFVILTDFEEFRFYDASIKPDERKPEEGLLLRLKYNEYLKNIDRLWEFSPQRVAAGSLDAMMPRDRRTQRLRIPVDEAFLDEVTGWRQDLARNIYKNNPMFTAKQLNEVVQRLLDRIVFVRIAEDRRIIEKRQLADVVDDWKARGGKLHIFAGLNDLFHRVNEDFNGEIFKPHLSETIKIDSEILARIIERLYPPKSPYRFDVIGVELLGSIYERYLGNTIRVTAKQVRVEEKPEVRRAGGVYYTPSYIVDYIVKNTVGKIIDRRTPRQIEKIRILDPACGSGSFLIGAFQCLIDYHVRYLTEHPKEARFHPLFPDLIPDGDGGHRLSVRLKAKILRNNLYGVDIDPQAVEITMMSLYLKALEGEKSQLPPKQHLLPELKYNIICGNSLIGADIYGQGNLFDEEKDRINPLDWQAEFPGILNAGGFDAVIGNPPWGADFSPEELEYLRRHYARVVARMVDSYIYFIGRAVSVARARSRVGLIVPSTILNQVDAKPVRELLLSRGLAVLVNLGQGIFGPKVLNTSTIFVSGAIDGRDKLQTANLSGLSIADRSAALGALPAVGWKRWKSLASHDPHLTFFAGAFEQAILLDRLRKKHKPLREAIRGEIQRGVSPDITEAHVVSPQEAKQERLEAELLRPSVSGVSIKRYRNWQADQFIVYTTRDTRPAKCPHVAERLKRFRHLNTCKEVQEGKHPWWSLHRPRDPAIFGSPKFIGLTTSKAIEVIYDEKLSVFVTDAMYLFCIRESLEPWAFMAVFQSKPFLFLYKIANQGESRVIPQVKASKLYDLPFPNVDATNPQTAVLRGLARRMLELDERKHSGKLSPSQLDRLEREIAATNARIDELVYELYGITSEERGIIEHGERSL